MPPLNENILISVLTTIGEGALSELGSVGINGILPTKVFVGQVLDVWLWNKALQILTSTRTCTFTYWRASSPTWRQLAFQ